MSFMLYVLSICIVVPLYIIAVNHINSPVDFVLDEMWKARLNLASPVVGIFAPVVLLTVIMVLSIIYVCYLGEIWANAFPKE